MLSAVIVVLDWQAAGPVRRGPWISEVGRKGTHRFSLRSERCLDVSIHLLC